MDRATATISGWQPARQRILVVDDQATNRQLLAHLLEPMAEVTLAVNGQEGLSLCQQQQPDLILLDIVMPGIDGFEVCRQLKADPLTRRIPVVFVTSSAEHESRAFELGAVDFIAKPFRPAAVIARVRAHLLLKQQSDLLRTLAFVDGLTGVANRRRLDDALQQEWLRARRHSQPLALLMVDVDHFQAYNDTLGHHAGDRALRQIAGAMAGVIQRPADLLARYGGEEFAVLLPETDLAGAMAIARQMVEAVQDLGLEHPASPTAATATISCGVTALLPHDDLDLQRLKDGADSALYLAKRSGRNRSACHSYD